MIKIEKTDVYGWEAAIRGMRNPLNSWNKSDTDFSLSGMQAINGFLCPTIGENDLGLMRKLIKAGADHRKFMRFIGVAIDITAPLYWWKEYDTYKVGTVANSCSTMHKIHAKEFTKEDFSCEYLPADKNESDLISFGGEWLDDEDVLEITIRALNHNRIRFLETKDKKYWRRMIQLLSTSYNQKRTVIVNYEVLCNMYKSRKNHKLEEWRDFCCWVETLPYSELITGNFGTETK